MVVPYYDTISIETNSGQVCAEWISKLLEQPIGTDLPEYRPLGPFLDNYHTLQCLHKADALRTSGRRNSVLVQNRISKIVIGL